MFFARKFNAFSCNVTKYVTILLFFLRGEKMKKLASQSFFVSLGLGIFCSTFLVTPLLATPYSLSDFEVVDVSGFSHKIFIGAPSSQTYLFSDETGNNEHIKESTTFKIESTNGIVGEKVKVGFTFNLTTKSEFNMYTVPINSIDFSQPAIVGEYKFFTQEVSSSFIARSNKNIYVENATPWNPSGTTQNTTFTFYQDLESLREYWLGAWAYAYDNLPNEIPALYPIVGYPIFDHLATGHAKLTNIFISRTTAAPVPEPTTILLFGIGLAGLAGARLRKKKK